MNLLLCKYDNIDNYELSNIINCYQDYFIFKVINSSIYLYLDTKVLKHYLVQGFNIKYRKHIFLFLKNSILSKKNTSYKLVTDASSLNINLNLYNQDSILKNYDIDNLEYIINISNKILHNKNKFYIKDKNIIKLDTHFYANIELGRFFFSKIRDSLFKYNSIILNYSSFKNKLLVLLSIYNINKINNNFSNIEFLNKSIKKCNTLFHTKCTLILCNKKDIDIWTTFIIKYLNKSKYYTIFSKKNLQKIKNNDVFELDFLFIDIKFLNSKYFKDYFFKYEIFINNNESYDSKIPIYNSIYDIIINKNIDNEKFNNLYIFNWNNVIYDNIEYIESIDKNNYMKYFITYNTHYFLSENYLEEDVYNYIIDISIKSNIDNDKNIFFENINNKLPMDKTNFYCFLQKELSIKDDPKTDYECDYIYIDIELTTNEKKLYNYLFHDIIDCQLNDICYKKIKDINTFIMNTSKYNFRTKSINEIEKINNQYYTNLINKESLKYDIFNNNQCSDINNINNINNINIYKSKILYFHNTIQTFNKSECYCTVCMDKIINNNTTCIVTCGHFFCKECILKYITEKNIESDLTYYECPICRTFFNIDTIYNICENDNISENDISKNLYKCSKLDKLFNIIGINKLYIENINNEHINNEHINNEHINNEHIKTEYVKTEKIIIVSQYFESVYSIKKYINDLDSKINSRIKLSNLFYNNISYKNKFFEIFNNDTDINIVDDSYKKYKYSIIICNYDDIIKYNFKKIDTIIFIDHPNENMLFDIKEKYSDKYLNKIRFYNKSFKIYFLYAKDTIEEKIFEKYLKINK